MADLYIKFQSAVNLILEEREKIPKSVPGRPYEFGIPQPNHSGDLIRGGIRKALRVLEQMPKEDVVPVVRCKDCEHWDESTCFCDIHSEFTIAGDWTMFDPDFFCADGERKVKQTE